MIYESGELSCPECSSSGMKDYTNCSSKVIFKGGKIKQYIFYRKKKSVVFSCII